jgi:hypothetical protein
VRSLRAAVALFLGALMLQPRLLRLVHEVLVGLLIAVLYGQGWHAIARAGTAAADHLRAVCDATKRVWMETVCLAIPIGKAIDRSPSQSLRAANWPSRVLAAAAIPVLLVPGIRATRWPTWLVLVLGVALLMAACLAQALHPGATLQTASNLELAIYAFGAATLAIPLRHLPRRRLI